MQKNKKAKIITVAGIMAILIGVIAGVLITSKQESVDNTDAIESIDFVKEFEDGISISGDVTNIYDVSIISSFI